MRPAPAAKANADIMLRRCSSMQANFEIRLSYASTILHNAPAGFRMRANARVRIGKNNGATIAKFGSPQIANSE